MIHSVMKVPCALGVLGLALVLVSTPLRAQEKAVPKTQLRVAVEQGKEYLFRQTLTSRGVPPIGGPSNFDVVQEFAVAGEPTDEGAGGWRLTTDCRRVRIACESAFGKGKWDSRSGAFTPAEMEKEDFEYLDLYASMMGVLAGKKPGVLLNRVGAVAALSGMGPVHAAAREAEPSSTFDISILEGAAWTPAYLFVQLPEDPVAKGDTFEFPIQWTTARPGVNLRHVAKATIDAVADGKATFSWKGTPTVWKRGLRGKLEEAPKGTVTDGKCSGSVTVSATDGLALAIEWTVSGVHHATVFGSEVTDKFELTMKVERVEKLDEK